MAPTASLLDRLEPLHADAFSWAAACCGGDLSVAEDVLQEAYVKVACGRAVFHERSALKTWWLGVVRLTALEQQRRARRWRRAAEFFVEWFSGLGGGSQPAASTLPTMEWVAAEIAKLPPRQAEVLQLVLMQRLTLDEAAQVMVVSPGSARRHYDRAKRRLRSLLPPAAPLDSFDHAC